MLEPMCSIKHRIREALCHTAPQLEAHRPASFGGGGGLGDVVDSAMLQLASNEKEALLLHGRL